MNSLGLGINKNFNIKKQFVGILDELGNSNSCVYTFSPYKRLTGAYKDELIRVINTSTFEEEFFGADKNGDLEIAEILTWLNGANGVVDWVANEAKPTHPTTQGNMFTAPAIRVSQVFQQNGLFFNGSTYFMQCLEYDEIKIILPSLTAYTNFYPTGVNRFVFCKNTNSNTPPAMYGFWNHANALNPYIHGVARTGTTVVELNEINRAIFEWSTRSMNGLKTRRNQSEASTACDVQLTNSGNLCIGAWFTNTVGAHFQGNLKSVVLFNSNQYNNFNNLVNGGI